MIPVAHTKKGPLVPSGPLSVTRQSGSGFPGQPWTAEVAVVRRLPVDGTQQVQRLDDARGTHVEGLADEVLGGLVVAGAERLDEQRGRLRHTDRVRELH